jgi:hypothetical protein
MEALVAHDPANGVRTAFNTAVEKFAVQPAVSVTTAVFGKCATDITG